MNRNTNIDIKGRYIIKFRNSITGEKTRPDIDKNNFLHERFYRELSRYNINDGYLTFSSYYIWKVNIPGYSYPNLVYDYDLSVNSYSSLVSSILPEGFSRHVTFGRVDDNPLYSQTYSRFPSTGSESTFNVLLLANSSSTTNCYVISSLILDPPITQGAYEDIDIYYNLEVPIEGAFIKSKAAHLALTANLNYNFTFDIRNIAPRYCSLPTTIQEDPINGYEYLSVFLNYIIGTNGANGSTIGVKNMNWRADPTTTDRLYTAYGMVFNTVFLGCYGYQDTGATQNKEPRILSFIGTNAEGGHIQGHGSAFEWFKYTDTLTEPFQSRFMKKSTAERPFWEATENVSTRGEIQVEGTWIPESRLPEVYRIQITNGGAVGTATYQVWIRKFVTIACEQGGTRSLENRTRNPTTFNGNSWENNLHTPIPFLHPSIPHARHRGSFIGYPKFPCPWNKEEIIMYDRKGFTILNVYDGTFRTWDKDSTPALPVTKLKQVSCDDSNRNIYVACKQTGLYVIDYNTSSVNKIVNEPCHAVDVGYSSKVFAIFDGRMSNNDNWSTPLPLLAKGINGSSIPSNSAEIPNSWSNVFYIKINRLSTTYNMAITVTSGKDPARYNNYRITEDSHIINWWNTSNNASTECISLYHSSNVGNCSNPMYLLYWPAGDIWVNGGEYFRFNSSSSRSFNNYTRRVNYPIINDSEDHLHIANKAVDNWDWFEVNNEQLFMGNHIYTSNPLIWKGYLLGDADIFTHMDSPTSFVKLDNDKQIYNSDWCREYFLLDDDLGITTIGHWDTCSFINLFQVQYNTSFYPILQYGWAKYGWNGTSWVQGDPGSKTTHTSLQKGPSNLDISFSDGTGTSPVFETGQYLLQYMANGFMMDNTTSYNIDYNLYISPTNLNVPFPSGFLVSGTSISQGIKVDFPNSPRGPNPDPLYIAPLSGNKMEIEIFINGTKANIYYDNEKGTPDSNEVVFHRRSDVMTSRIDLYEDDYYLIFNPNDNGKSITGFYGYIKYPVP